MKRSTPIFYLSWLSFIYLMISCNNDPISLPSATITGGNLNLMAGTDMMAETNTVNPTQDQMNQPMNDPSAGSMNNAVEMDQSMNRMMNGSMSNPMDPMMDPMMGGEPMNDPVAGVMNDIQAGTMNQQSNIDPFEGSIQGSVPNLWNNEQYCIATFTQDFDILKLFSDDEVLFTISEGSQYLLTRLRTNKFDIIYFTDSGSFKFKGEVEDGTPLPFTSNCDPSNRNEDYTGVFVDTIVYRDTELTDVACQLSAGTITFGTVSYSAQDSTYYSTYEVSSSSLGTICNGVETGYVNATRMEAFNDTFTSSPIMDFLGLE